MKLSYLKIFAFTLVLASMLATANAFAYTAQSLGTVAENITLSMNNVAKLITAASYVTGIGFALMGLLKLKAHKDQPQQVPLSQPLVLLLISTGLVFLPSLITTTGQTLWRGGQVAANTYGTGIDGVSNY